MEDGLRRFDAILLAAEDAEAVEVGQGRGEHAEQALARREPGHEVADAPAGQDVSLNVQASRRSL
jgi:hypothetical protein